MGDEKQRPRRIGRVNESLEDWQELVGTVLELQYKSAGSAEATPRVVILEDVRAGTDCRVPDRHCWLFVRRAVGRPREEELSMAGPSFYSWFRADRVNWHSVKKSTRDKFDEAWMGQADLVAVDEGSRQWVRGRRLDYEEPGWQPQGAREREEKDEDDEGGAGAEDEEQEPPFRKWHLEWTTQPGSDNGGRPPKRDWPVVVYDEKPEEFARRASRR